MGFIGYKHKDREVIKWAELYIARPITFMELEERYDVSHSTIWWNFQHRLPAIDVSLYDRVLEVCDRNKRIKPVSKIRK